MRRNIQYGVQFVGYSAELVVLTAGVTVHYGTLDFVSGSIQYGVQFVGYSAEFVVLKAGVTVHYGTLDFVSGSMILKASEGWITVPKLDDLGKAVRSLPRRADQLRELVKQKALETNDQFIEFEDKADIHIKHGADVDVFCSELAERFVEIKRLLKQAEKLGRTITRRPYSEYIDEIARTGIARVEVHGFGLFVGGKLSFYPKRRTALVKEESPNQYLIQELDPTST
jgi:hypothetical protein